LLSSEQLLQTIAQMNEVERQRGDYARQFQQIDNQARVDDLDKLQQATRQMAELRSMMDGVNDRMALLGHLGNDLTGKAELGIFRKDADGSVHVAAAADASLEPGDVVEVTLPNNRTNNRLQASATPVR
jgi:polysaccharide export outer membrane protein